jgi:retron-type reverse transcriptase
MTAIQIHIGRSPAARQPCWRYDWVPDLDIKSFFDTIDWTLLLRALRRAPDQ